MMPLATSLRRHWPEYGIEAAGLAIFMASALSFSVLLQHPASPVRGLLPSPLARQALMGVVMGGTGMALVYSPWGMRSGAHFNPALTFAFYRLGRVETPDALFYMAAQFVGGLAGVAGAALVIGPLGADPHVRFAVTVPGALGVGAAFAAETAISAGLMFTVLLVSNAPGWNRFTGIFAGSLVALYITFEAPLSGMSMNPARTLGSAARAGVFDHLWVYFAAPALGMLLAAELYLRSLGAARVRCAKLHHENEQRCIFRCGYAA